MTRTKHPRRSRRRANGEKGLVLILTALLLVPLTVFTAFAVDLGSWYAQSSREQRAVDAASLAGVVQLPTQSSAITAAQDALKSNGYTCTLAAQSTGLPSSGTPCTYSFPQGAGEEMQIWLYAPASQYFSGVVLKGESLTRTATAVYNLHIPLASPSYYAGNNLTGATGSTGTSCIDPQATCAGSEPLVWGAINGPYSNREDGDSYSTKCEGENGGTDTSCSTKDVNGNGVTNPNPLYNQGGYNGSGGYVWVVDVPAADAGSTITVQVYDPSQSLDGNLGEGLTPGQSKTCQPPTCGAGFNTSFGLYNTTGSNAAYNLSSTNQMTCSAGPGNKVFPAGQDAWQSATPQGTPGSGTITYYTDQWYSLCSFTAPAAGGQFPLLVKSSGIPGFTDSGGGWNAYALRATTTNTTKPTVYAINDMSIWTNPNANTNGTPVISKFYLANIGAQYAGHTLVIDMYDPGDGGCAAQNDQTKPLQSPRDLPASAANCNFTMSILQPPGGTPNNPPTSGAAVPANEIPCKYNSTGSLTYPATNLDTTTTTNCNITTRDVGNNPVNKYNGLWMRVEIQIPPAGTAPGDYNCSADCWWTVAYNYGNWGTPTDRTVWVVNVLGDPVHLIQ